MGLAPGLWPVSSLDLGSLCGAHLAGAEETVGRGAFVVLQTVTASVQTCLGPVPAR